MEEHRQLNEKERAKLLEVARRTITDLVTGRPAFKHPPEPEGLGFKRGAFVTLNSRGALRGCIGNFVSEGPLVEMVENMAVAAASQDPRFHPVRPEELDVIDLEISVLSPLEEIDDPQKVEVGTHGVYIISPRGRGVLLPQVATEYGWDRETFLDQTCIKAGLAPGCWKDPETKILVFSAQVFGEKD